jgi:DHA1 family tetracycline resistance protein-like MFS transporter
VVFSTVLLDLVGFTMLLPVLPFYAQQYGASKFQVFLLYAAYSLAQFVVAPLLGRLSDRIGRRPVMLLSIAGDVVSYLVLAAAHGYAVVLLARIAAGVSAANYSIGQAWVADQTGGQERSRALGLLGAAFGLAFVLGPPLGVLVSKFFGTTAVPLVAAALSVANLIYAWLRFSESRPPSSEARSLAAGEWLSVRGLVEAVSAPRVGALLVLFWLVTFAFASLESTLALFCQGRFGFDVQGTGYLLTFVGLVNATIQGGALGPLVQRFGEWRLAIAGIALAAVGLGATGFAADLPLLILAMGILAIGVGLHTPTLYGLISRSTTEDRQGGVLGVTRSLAALARGLGPLTGGLLFTQVGDAWPFWFGGLVMAVTGLLAVHFARRAGA